uniref:Uncharacterized protein n=1 Tax=Timema bartmani TaxID=61472 RepID=A0A7R9HZZ8_9NEOP|nr:unnamed protein product [Timema bartmani]
MTGKYKCLMGTKILSLGTNWIALKINGITQQNPDVPTLVLFGTLCVGVEEENEVRYLFDPTKLLSRPSSSDGRELERMFKDLPAFRDLQCDFQLGHKELCTLISEQIDSDYVDVVKALIGLKHKDARTQDKKADGGSKGKVIVHGALLNGLVSGVIGTKLPGPGTKVLSQSLEYPNSCYADEEVSITIEITTLQTTLLVMALENLGSLTPVLWEIEQCHQSCHNRLKTPYRNSLKTETLDDLPKISINEHSLSELDQTAVIDNWYFSA